ncbi:MAG TPA: DNA polymerase III subunit [Dehalococcoidia bacterium]|nr:DNA polymerase III subunit [Dehalococcoidia bacterium]
MTATPRAADPNSRPPNAGVLPWGLLGQDAEVAALARAVAAGQPAHAYLIGGPAGAGKGTLARRLAQALNCDAPRSLPPDGVAPCGDCRQCRQIEAGSHPDVTLVTLGGLCARSEHDHGKDGSKDIRICQVRALEDRVNRSPFQGRWRVEIVDPADALNAVAADAFLKTLEEPPASVVLVLVTAQDDALPETVRSRLRPVAVRPVPAEQIERFLVARGSEAEDAALLARLSRGCTGWALAAAANPGLLEERARRLDAIAALGEAGLADRFAAAAQLAQRWSKDRAGVLAELDLWLEWWRDVALGAAGAERGILNVDRLARIRERAASVSPAAAARAVQAVRAARGQLEENANARLALEVMLLRMPGRTPGIEGVERRG